MRISITGLGELGIFRDVPAHALPPNAWTDGRNVRFADNVVMPTGKDIPVLGPLQVGPYWLHYGINAWTYVGDAGDTTMSAWAIDSTQTHVELSTVIKPSWSSVSRVTGGNINGLVVINPKTDAPVYWLGEVPVANKLQWLPWDGTDTWKSKNWFANSIRPHKRWLFALGTNEDGTQYPQRIRNSASAPPNSIPATWDDADTTNDAAFVDDPAADRYAFVDGLSMGDEFVAYTEQTTWVGQSTGIVDAPFRFRKAFDFVGMLATDCVATQGRRHFVLTQEDLVAHDGSSAQSLLRGSNRRWLFRNIDVQSIDVCFVYLSRVTNELWVCFPEQGASHCTKALVLDPNDSSRVGVRDLPNLRSVDMGSDFPALTVLNYGSANFTYAVSNFPYTQTSAVRDAEDRLGASPIDTSGFVCLKHYSDVVDPQTLPITSYVERSHITFPGESRTELQDGRILRCTAIYPTFSNKPAGDIKVYLGVSNNAGETPVWHGPQIYNVNTTRGGRVPFRQQGRYLGVRFEMTDGADWQLSGYDMDIQPLGYRT